MTRVSIWVARRPEDELADAIAAADRRKTMDDLKVRHNVVDPAKPVAPAAAGECRWCPTRQQLETMPDGKQRMPEFGRRIMSSADRRTACKRCVKTALATLKRRVDTGRSQNSGGATRGTKWSGVHKGSSRLAGHHVDRVVPPDLRQRVHDPFGTCSVCQDYRRAFPTEAALTAGGGGIPRGCPPHPWNEPPKARRVRMRR